MPDLSFSDLREVERTKHIHRLHPYLGKFIPQLVEYYLRDNFEEGQTILDPFVGSGTTLAEANLLGINSIGIDISTFNCLIAKVKTQKYNIPLAEEEIKDLLRKTKIYSKQKFENQTTLSGEGIPTFKTNSNYLKKWLGERTLQEILFYKSQISNYYYKDLLKIILGRSVRSARLVPHYELTRAKEPIKGKYYCHKHNRMCSTIDEGLKFINRYSLDTIKRIKQFDGLRTNADIKIIKGDARNLKLPSNDIDGVFTSPPYVGLIDYHDQHKYAYELFDIENNEEGEIGPQKRGKSKEAKDKYVKDIASVLLNINRSLKDSADIFIVANDSYNLYNDIAKRSNLRIVDVVDRKVTKKASRERTPYSESIFHMKKH